MEFFVEKAVLDSGVKILFAKVEGMDNASFSPEWNAVREGRIAELLARYDGFDVHADPVLEGFNILHDRTGVKRRKNVPAAENLIKLLQKNRGMSFINKAVDIYNIISLDTKLALGAHDMDKTDGNVTLRFTDGSERYVPLGMTEAVAVNPHEYCYCDDLNEVLCRLEIRQVAKTKVDEDSRNVFYIIEGNEATEQDYLWEAAERVVKETTAYCGGSGFVIEPAVIE